MNNFLPAMNKSVTEIADGKARVWIQVLNTLLIFIIVGGNGFALIVLKRTTSIKFVTKMLLISLVGANILVGLGYVAPQSILLQWGHLMNAVTTSNICVVSTGIGVSGAAASVLSLLLVNIERYIAIEWPLRYNSILTKKTAAILTTVKWILVLSVAVSYLAIAEPRAFYQSEWKMCMVIPKFETQQTRFVIIICLYVFAFIMLPAVVTICIYARILVIVHRRISEEDKLTSSFPTNYKNKQRRDKKASLTFLMVTITFIITWLPFSVGNLYRLHDADHLYPELEIISYLTFASNHWLTSVVFVTRDLSFRNSVKKIMCRKRNI